MKPSFVKNVLLFCLPAVMLAGCSGIQPEQSFSPKLDPAYSVQAALAFGTDETAGLKLTRISADSWTAEFSAPESVAGVLLEFEGNAVQASYKGLAFSVPKSALPAKNMLLLAAEVLDSAAGAEPLACTQRDDGTWESAGTCTAGSYTLCFGADGTLLSLEIPSQPLVVTFSGYSAVQPEESTEPAETTSAASAAETTAETTGCTS